MNQYAKILVARYLRENGFKEALRAFSSECSQSFQEFAGEESYVERLEDIVAERIAFSSKSLESQLEKLAVVDAGEIEDTNVAGVHNAEFRPVESVIADKKSLAIGASFCGTGDYSLVSYADRAIDRYDDRWRLQDRLDVSEHKFGAVKLCGTLLNSGMYYFCGLDGSFVIYEDASCSGPKLHFKLHQRMITHIGFFTLKEDNSWLIVSCGLDNHLRLHKLGKGPHGLQIDHVASEKLLSPCTSLLVVSHDKRPLVLVTRNEHTHVLCYMVDPSDYKLVLGYRIALNNAEFSTFSFSVRDMAFVGQLDDNRTLAVSKGSSLLVATSHVPYMRLIEVEIPLPPKDLGTTFYNQVVRNAPTEVEQDSYSEPILKLVPYGRDVLVGDSRGVYAVCTLTGRSWLLDLPAVSKGSRVKSMDVNKEGTKLIVAFSDKTVAAFDVVV